ncbi:transmembrane protein 126A isoform X2 [Mirounga angustirostris]|uniref:transmembrane protein 126A isoform X2 n=1 Tax=Mirounga angustirostris TaxID=9716 RepID=UPI0023E4262A|nr:transmembrane protein 126A isoform X2 [Mirounga angustirostris]
MENHEPNDTVKEDLIFNIITRKINQLPEAERNLFEHGSTYVGLNAGLCGLIANSLFRRILNVTQARIAAGLPMAVIPFLTAHISYKGFVSLPLNTGDLNCETCTITRGGLVGLVFGALYPVILAIPVNGGLAARERAREGTQAEGVGEGEAGLPRSMEPDAGLHPRTLGS